MEQPNDQLIRTLVSYLPPAVARAVHADPRPLQEPQVDRFPAAVLLCDVSGFTALTEKLAVYGAGGAEELIQILDSYFSRMIGLLEAEGGEVVQFSGDALTAVFLADVDDQRPERGESAARIRSRLPLAGSVRRAWQAAARMQAAMDEFATLQTSAGPVRLGMKIAIGCGIVVALSVGGVFGRWQYIIAGDPLRQVAEAEHIARVGQIVLSAEARELFDEAPLAPRPLAALEWHEVTTATLDALRTHIPGAITHRLMAGQADWLAELRRMSILFIGVNGLSADTPDALSTTQASMLAFQQTVYRYEGSINKLLVDDKGAICIVLFGAPPLAHLDDPLRAVRCALDLRQIGETLGLRLAIGITTGQVFAGPVGSPTRREYTVMGDTVNLAARLMQATGPGGIRADHATHQATRAEIDWEALAPQAVKGKAQPVRVYQPTGRRAERRDEPEHESVLGRGGELARLAHILSESQAGHLRVICISGAPGIGKSRLVAEAERLGRERGQAWLIGSGQAIEQRAAYRGWSEIFSGLFDLERLVEPGERLGRFTQRLEELFGRAPDAGLTARLPLLNELLDLGLPETPLTAALEPEPRRAALAGLLIEILHYAARAQPLLIALDDAQWLDSLAWQLAWQLANELTDRPITLLLALRPLEEAAPDHPLAQIRALPHSAALDLAALDSADTAALAARCLEARDMPPDLAALIERRSAGNPFLIRELADNLRESGAVAVEGDRCVLRNPAALEAVPETVQGLVLSRIDRLPVAEQLTIKVAAVIGRTFGDATLLNIHPGPQQHDEIRRHLSSLAGRDLVALLPAPAVLYSHEFRQTIFQEVTYGTLLSAQRRALHGRLAHWYEEQVGEQRVLSPLLAYHWRQAGNPKRELHYAVLAARVLAAEYANAEALTFLERALALCEDQQQRFELLWLQLQLHERLGDSGARLADLQQIEAVVAALGSTSLLAQTWNAWADFYRDTSDYPAALAALDRAEALARAGADQIREARSLTIRGQVLEYQGAFSEAGRFFEQALELYRRIGYRRGEANNLSQLGNIALTLGDYSAARAYDQQALEIRRAIGDRASEVISLSNLSQSSQLLGEPGAAREYAMQALQIARAIGDRSGEALSLSMLADVYFTQGDYAGARQYFEQALRMFRTKGERRREANSLNMLGMVWRDLGEAARARESFEQAIATQREIGDLGQLPYSLLNLGYMLLDEAPAAAGDCYEQALAIARETGNREAEPYALSYRAAYYERLGHVEQAEHDLHAALAIRDELQMAAAAIEDRAALGRLALSRGAIHEACAHAEACLAYLEASGVEGIEFPLQVYLACVDILRASGDDRGAYQAIADAHALLIQRAASISDSTLRERMLARVPAARRIQAEFRALAGLRAA